MISLTPKELKEKYESKDCKYLTYEDVALYADTYLMLDRPAKTYSIEFILDRVLAHAGVSNDPAPFPRYVADQISL